MRPSDRVPSFTMRQLVAFVAVAETGTISGAAERLLVSQSAVSMAITELERALQAQLCVRRRAHGVQLMPTGNMLPGRARLLLRAFTEVHPAVSVHFVEAMADRLAEGLDTGELKGAHPSATSLPACSAPVSRR